MKQQGRKPKFRLWGLRWPKDTGAPHEFLDRHVGIPAVFFSRDEARRWKRNNHLHTPRIVELVERGQ